MKSTACTLVSLITLSCSLFADSESRLQTLEKEMQEISARNPQETLGASFVTARPDVIDSNWYIAFDITYWHTKMGGTEYAYSVDRFDPANSLPVNGDVKHQDFSWEVGVKAGLGYKTPHDNWDIFARYTWFNTDTSNSSFKHAPSALISLTWWQSFELVASHVKSHFELNYDNVELELARSYFISRQISFRPHFGLKSAWMTFHRTVTSTASGLSPAHGTQVGLDYKSKDHENFWGVGPRAGVDSKWYLGYGFNIFGDVAASILYGYFDTVHKDIYPPSFLEPFIEDGKADKIKHKFHRFIPFLQMALGLEWNTDLNDHKQHLGLKLGYEVQYYWRINQFYTVEDRVFSGASNALQFEKESEDVMFYGITGEIRLDF